MNVEWYERISAVSCRLSQEVGDGDVVDDVEVDAVDVVESVELDRPLLSLTSLGPTPPVMESGMDIAILVETLSTRNTKIHRCTREDIIDSRICDINLFAIVDFVVICLAP
jgi:hypothetical protein